MRGRKWKYFSIVCHVCMLRQALEASRMATENHGLQETIMEDEKEVIADYKRYRCTPDMFWVFRRLYSSYR